MAYTTVKTPIVYYGGKTAILNHLLDMVPVHDVYTETFFGGGTLFFAKDPVKNETINDKLDIVVNFYRQLRMNYPRLKRLINATLIGRTIHTEALALIKAHKKGKKVDKVRLAWAFWVCTNFAYSNKIGGGYKYSNDMSVSVPDTLLKRKENFTEAIVHRIEHAYIENDDALKILKSRNVKKAFHYLDPPYINSDQGHYAGYSDNDMIDLLDTAAALKGKFLLSNYSGVILDSYILKHGWHKKEISMKISGARSLNSRKGREAKGQTYRKEILVSNYSTACGTLKLF